MDFYRIKQRRGKHGTVDVYPDFIVCRSKDLMVRAKSFYAIWDEEKGLWSTDEYDVQRLVDKDLEAYGHWLSQKTTDPIKINYLGDFSSSSWKQFRSYMQHLSDNSHDLDVDITFNNSDVKKEDYVSRKLPYDLVEGPIDAYEHLITTLYDPPEREKLEWAVGAVIAGDSKWIQKFVVLYGSAGAGKSTWLNILQKLTEGYYTTFEAKSLVGNNNAFASEVFRSNPLVAIQHDGDLSSILDNTKLNSIVSHEQMTINEKFKPSYTSRINAFLFMGTNKPVKITDAKSGIIRRLIDVQPSGRRVSPRKYQTLMQQINFELGAIAYHCLEQYRLMGPDYYSTYRPVEMMLQTDIFYNFIEENYDLFSKQNGTSLAQAYELYKTYCDETLVEYKLARHKFREELKNYFEGFSERHWVNGENLRSWYSGFKLDMFNSQPASPPENVLPLIIDRQDSIFDIELADMPAQYANNNETPSKKWEDVTTTLAELDTHKLHYVKLPLNHIVIDFDLKDNKGNKSLEENLLAASKWPATYAEFSKGGSGVHLHYIYDGDVEKLARLYDKDIEIKVFVGNSSLRRRLSFCNNTPIATITGGLPTKEKKMIDKEAVKSEQHLRSLVEKALRKEVHAGTKPSIDFIHYILEEAYNSGAQYDLTDMRSEILAFANGSTNQALYCIKLVQHMKFKSQEEELNTAAIEPVKEERLVFFDLEVFPNLLVISWKYENDDFVTTMYNPSPQEVEKLLTLLLIGFNNRKYDNHILYAAMMGYSNQALYELSKRLIGNDRNAYFGAAYNLSYADIYDYLSKKQSLKRWEVELGILHMELGFDWDSPVPEEHWERVGTYCENDVRSEEAVFHARKQDFIARQILSELSGLKVNSTTQQHTAKIIFEGNRNPQESFVYTDLSEMFPGYVYDYGVSTYRDEVVGEGGYVYAEPGMYENVVTLDIASMHPTSIEQLNAFGPYTKKFSELKQARIAIKRGDYASARKMFNGALAPFLEDDEQAESLSYALKICINIVYGLTAASFNNPFKDPRNKDNIVAKRGALFMIDLKHAVQEQGFQVIHIKTDSIKIPNATPEIIDFVMEFGDNYGYEFEHEDTYEKICLVNDAVYIGKTVQGRKPPHWEAVGAQFAHPYVFKTLFSKEQTFFDDLIEIKQVSTALYLDFSVEDPMFTADDKNPHFVGRVGAFVPVVAGSGGGALLRIDKSGEKFHAATGSKHWLWKEAPVVQTLGLEDQIDMSYYEQLVHEAKKNLGKFGDVTQFLD